KDAGFLVSVPDAAAAVDTAVHDQRAGVHVQALRLVPDRRAVGRADAIKTVVTGAEVDFAIDDAGRRFRMTERLHRPNFLASVGVEAEETATRMLVEAFARVEPAVHDTWRREDV